MLTFVGMAVFLTITLYYVYIFAIWNWNEDQAEKYAQNAVYRAELLIDNTLSKMREARFVSNAGCDSPTLNSIRRTSYTLGVVHEVRIKKGNSQCWAFNNPHLPLATPIAEAERFPARNPDYELFFIRSNEINGLGVEWSEQGDVKISAVMSVAHILYDVLPPEIRDNAEVDIKLGDGMTVSSYPPQHTEADDIEDAELFTASSERYPLTADLAVDSDVMWSWNRTFPPFVVIPVVAIIAGLSYFITRGIVQDQGFVSELETAIARKEILPFYQPIYSLRTGKITGFEMLARWRKQSGQMIPPDKFIPVAEESGQIDAILDLLLGTAGTEIGALLRERPDLKLTFNVTPKQYLSDGFVSLVSATLKTAGIPLKSAVIEITERQALNDSEKSTQVSRALLQAGIRIAIDDAGTGHNGLSSIHSLDAQILKIDKYFVDALLLDKKSSTIIEMLISIAKEFGMTVVAEGIEKSEQAESLAKIGVQEGQGYYFSKPVPAASLPDLIASDTKSKITSFMSP